MISAGRNAGRNGVRLNYSDKRYREGDLKVTIAAGMPISDGHPHRSVWAQLGHTAPALDV